MSNPFEISDLPDGTWSVVWPEFSDEFTDRMKFNMLNSIFYDIKCKEVGLGVAEDKYTEASILWIKDDTFFQDVTEEYCSYLYKYYHIRGAVFRKQSEAEHFKIILEKRYMWQLLKE